MNIGYIAGAAGAGKSHLTASLHHWMNLSEYDVGILNLDPGVVRLPYTPDIDVRAYVSYDDVVDRYGLGPNGGLIVAMDHVALAMDDILDELQDLSPEFLLVDFPGQIEILAFRSSGKLIIDDLSRENSIAGLFLIDPTLCTTASSFVSTLLFGTSISYRLGTAMQFMISKSDILKPERLDRIHEWSDNPDFLYQDLMDERTTLNASLSRRLAEILITQEGLGEMPAISAETNENMDMALGILERAWGTADLGSLNL